MQGHLLFYLLCDRFQHGFCCFHIVIPILHTFHLEVAGQTVLINENCCGQTFQIIHDPFCQMLIGHDACKGYSCIIISCQCFFLSFFCRSIDDYLYKVYVGVSCLQVFIEFLQSIQFVDAVIQTVST